MKDLFAWLDLGRWMLLIGLAAALWLGYQAWADHQQEIGRDEVRAEYARKAKTVDDTRAAIGPPIAEKQATTQARIRTVTETIIKEVPVYVKTTDCPLPGGFRVLHDAAADGELPNPAGIPDAAAVAAQEAANTVAANYGTCHQTSERLTGLQEWVRAQAELKSN